MKKSYKNVNKQIQSFLLPCEQQKKTLHKSIRWLSQRACENVLITILRLIMIAILYAFAVNYFRLFNISFPMCI